MTLAGTDYEHRRYAAMVRFSARACRAAPPAELRRIVRGMVAHAICLQTGLGYAEAQRLVREGTVWIEETRPGVHVAAGIVTVRLDAPK